MRVDVLHALGWDNRWSVTFLTIFFLLDVWLFNVADGLAQS